jgi:hypothetical protein
LNFQRFEIIFNWGSVYFNLNCDGSSPGGWCEGECRLDSERHRGEQHALDNFIISLPTLKVGHTRSSSYTERNLLFTGCKSLTCNTTRILDFKSFDFIK